MSTQNTVGSASCADCARITAESIITPHRLHHKDTFEDLVSSAESCKLCKLLKDTLEARHQAQLPSLQGKPVFLYGARIQDRVPECPTGGNGDTVPYALARVKIACGTTHQNLDPSVNVYGPTDEIAGIPAKPSILGANVPVSVDKDLVLAKKWLSNCEDNHRDTCKPPISCSNVEVNPPRLYDIEEGRVVEFKSEDDRVQYTALSYLWGESKVSAKIKECQTIGSLKDVKNNNTTANLLSNRIERGSFWLAQLEKCPLAYAKAIEVTKTLGLKYIWIDSICILQDSDADKQKHFESEENGVGQIYENAKLTVCAIYWNADFDLYADRTKPENLIKVQQVSQNGERLVFTSKRGQLTDDTSCIRVIDEIDRDTQKMFKMQQDGYNLRGWTFQERLLSRRMLVFTETQMYFECKQIYEESGDLMRTADYRRDLRTCDTYDEIANIWPRIVRDFSGRTLSYWSDRVNAVRGIATQLIGRAKSKNIADIKFWSGLFDKSLHLHLLWRASGYGKNAGIEKIAEDVWVKSTLFLAPTWSWAYYRGRVDWDPYLSNVEAQVIPKNYITNAQIKQLSIPKIRTLKDGSKVEVVMSKDELHFETAELVDVIVGPLIDAPGLTKLKAGFATDMPGGHTSLLWTKTRELHNPEGSIVGWGTFDTEQLVETEVSALLVSTNNINGKKSSVNILLVDVVEGSSYRRLGMGELLAAEATGDSKNIEQLVLL